jgi:hypothetical protein
MVEWSFFFYQSTNSLAELVPHGQRSTLAHGYPTDLRQCLVRKDYRHRNLGVGYRQTATGIFFRGRSAEIK